MLLFVFLSLIYFIHNSFGEVYNFKEKWGSLCKLNETKWFCNIDELSTDDSFHFPTGIAVDNKGDVYVSDSWNDRVQKFTSNGKFITKWGTRGSADGQFRFPTGIAVDNKGDVYVSDFSNDRVQKFTSNGQFITKWGTSGSADGQFGRDDDTFFTGPAGIAVDNKGDVYVSDFSNDRVQKFTSNGKFITKWGTSGSADGQFRFPTGIEVDNKGDVYVGDSLNMRIQKFTSNGKFITKIMPEKIQGDIGSFENIFAIDLFSQNIFVTDSRTDS